MTEPRVSRIELTDLEPIMQLASESLGWAGDQRDREFFRWKHLQNPNGESPAWGVWDDDRLVAFRVLMRWTLEREGERASLVRAVDTATAPDQQGKGLFRRLTTGAVEELTASGDDAVFNTPNDQSRPGYLKMGWVVLGRPTIQVSPRSPMTMVRMLRSRVGAEKWSEPLSVGQPVREVASDLRDVDRGSRWSTPRTAEYLGWRYGFEPLHYRAVEVKGGACIFRVRRRGTLREVAICEWLSERADPRSVRRLVRAAGDYAVGVGLSPAAHGVVPLPGQGPIVTWRALARADVPALSDLDFALGDLELF